MLLILEIALTVAAWRKGWRGWALVPMVIPGALGFAVGAACGASGTDFGEALAPCLVVELACLAVLAVMAIRGRRLAQPVSTGPSTREAGASAGTCPAAEKTA